MQRDGDKRQEQCEYDQRHAPSLYLNQPLCQGNKDYASEACNEGQNGQCTSTLLAKPGRHQRKGWIVEDRCHYDTNANPDQVEQGKILDCSPGKHQQRCDT